MPASAATTASQAPQPHASRCQDENAIRYTPAGTREPVERSEAAQILPRGYQFPAQFASRPSNPLGGWVARPPAETASPHYTEQTYIDQGRPPFRCAPQLWRSATVCGAHKG